MHLKKKKDMKLNKLKNETSYKKINKNRRRRRKKTDTSDDYALDDPTSSLLVI